MAVWMRAAPPPRDAVARRASAATTLPVGCGSAVRITARALAVPDVEDVGRALLVAPAVGPLGLDEPVPFVEPVRAGVGRERPQPESLRPLALGEPQKFGADAAARHRRFDVELIKPGPAEHHDAGEGAGLVLGDPQLAFGEHVGREPGAYVVVAVDGCRNDAERGGARAQPHIGGRSCVGWDPGTDRDGHGANDRATAARRSRRRVSGVHRTGSYARWRASQRSTSERWNRRCRPICTGGSGSARRLA